MKDNELIALFIPLLSSAISSFPYSLSGIKILQSTQPVNQGVQISPCVYFFKISTKFYGSPRQESYYDTQTQSVVRVESQYVESVFQFSTLVTQTASDETQLTASDLLVIVAQIVQSQSMTESLRAAGVGRIRITDIRNPYFKDDRDRLEASPSFDLTFTYKNEELTPASNIDNFISGIYPI